MSRKNENAKKNYEEILSLWENENKDGFEYLSGVTKDGKKVVAFYNDKKKNDKEPDIRVYFSK